MAEVHSLRMHTAWPWGARGKKHYRAGCSCGWCDTQTYPLRRTAESSHFDHKAEEKRKNERHQEQH